MSDQRGRTEAPSDQQPERQPARARGSTGGRDGSEQDQVVAVHDLALVGRAELALEVVRGPADQAGISSASKLTSPRATGTPVGAGQVDRVAGDERAR